MKYRIRITQILTAVLLLAAKPYSWELFRVGVTVALLGELLRGWSAGNIKKDKTLAVTGPYVMLRNPLYLGSALMAAGFTITCINPSYPFVTTALVLAVIIGFKYVYRAQVDAEEKHLEDIFGEQYREYKKSVESFDPDFSKFGEAVKTCDFTFAQYFKNREHVTVLGFLSVAVFIALRIHYGI